MTIGSPPVNSTSRDLGVAAQVRDAAARSRRCANLQVLHADELRPAEAVRAVGVAGLPLAGEEQHRLAVLVLQARQRRRRRAAGRCARAGRPGCGLSLQADRVRHGADLLRRCASRAQQRRDLREIGRLAACPAAGSRAGRSDRRGLSTSRSARRRRRRWCGTAARGASARMASRLASDRPPSWAIESMLERT